MPVVNDYYLTINDNYICSIAEAEKCFLSFVVLNNKVFDFNQFE